MIERFFVGPDAHIGPLDGSFRRGVSPPAGGEFLSQRWERNQWPRPPSLAPSGQFTLRIAGDAADGLRLRYAPPRSIGPLSPDPITGVIPLSGQNISGAQNQECLSAVPSGPTGGLSRREIGTGAVSLPRLPLPNQRYWCEFWRAHAMRPYGFRRTVGAAISRPKAFPFRGRCPRRGRMRYPIFRTKLVGSASSGAGMESHQSQFSPHSGPQWGRTG